MNFQCMILQLLTLLTRVSPERDSNPSLNFSDLTRYYLSSVNSCEDHTLKIPNFSKRMLDNFNV